MTDEVDSGEKRECWAVSQRQQWALLQHLLHLDEYAPMSSLRMVAVWDMCTKEKHFCNYHFFESIHMWLPKEESWDMWLTEVCGKPLLHLWCIVFGHPEVQEESWHFWQENMQPRQDIFHHYSVSLIVIATVTTIYIDRVVNSVSVGYGAVRYSTILDNRC